MTREDTIKVMTILRVAYPNFYRSQDKQEARAAIDLWASMFADDDPAVVAAAVKALIVADDKGYPPHIGAVKAKMRKLTSPHEMSEGEAWGKISLALQNGIYGAKKEFEKLPPVLQKVVGSPNQLREWAVMDLETVQSVVASNVQRSYRTHVQREREYNALPNDVKALVSGLADSLALEAHE